MSLGFQTLANFFLTNEIKIIFFFIFQFNKFSIEERLLGHQLSVSHPAVQQSLLPLRLRQRQRNVLAELFHYINFLSKNIRSATEGKLSARCLDAPIWD